MAERGEEGTAFSEGFFLFPYPLTPLFVTVHGFNQARLNERIGYMSMKTPESMVRGVFILWASQPVEDTECPKQGTTRYAGGL